MKSWKKPTNEMVDNALDSIKKVTARKYFFSQLENPLWLKPLTERNCFKSPPKTQRFDDGTVIHPYWHEAKYLKNVCSEKPDEVINIVADLPEIDNPVVYDGILDIALQLPIEYSVELKDKIIEYAGMKDQFHTYRYADLLERWIEENQTSAALELSKVLIAFAPDTQEGEKRKQRDNANDLREMGGTTLYPAPKLNLWEYSNIMSKGIQPLAEKESFSVACLLMDTTADMIRLRTHQKNYDKDVDLSDVWCPRLFRQDIGSENREKTLVHTLTYACEKVFENSPDEIAVLDEVLRKKQWYLFRRLRYHLYAKYPNEQTKQWIREQILTHEGFGSWEHRYEFQQMIRCACDYFKETLLTQAERTQIFETILAGPSKENYRHWVVKWLGQIFTEDGYRERQQRFHWMQLRPFESILFGKYETHFNQLKNIFNKQLSDDDYPILRNIVNTGRESDHSKRKPENISNLPDTELLAFINEWEKSDEYYEELNIETLANTFQDVFKENIIPDPNRLKFWMTNREQIERPIYISVMIYAMEAQIKEKNFDYLDEWFAFCKWVLLHSDQPHRQDYKQGDESRQDKNWTNARRAVGDFIGVCLAKDVDVPISAQKHLAKLLEMLCTQHDWNLDENHSSGLDSKDPLIEGVNNTRSKALENLFRFGIWLQRHEPDCEVPEITTLLEIRFSSKVDYPLTLPEYAIIGKYYLTVHNFNKKWTIAHKSDFFPQGKHPEWVAAFSSFILFNDAYKPIFEILKDDFNFALQHLPDFKKHDMVTRHPADAFGERLFHYYLLEMFPLEGQESLLEQFYQQTEKTPEHWANVFKIIGDRLLSTGQDFDPNMENKVKTFFEWRLKQEEPAELKYFTTWLQAKCLEAQWRLESYSKVIDVCKGEVYYWEIYLRELCQMLPNHTAKVVECFAKLTVDIKGKNIYIPPEEAKTILQAGLNSTETIVFENAERALGNLLRADKMEYMDLVIDKNKPILEH